MRVGTARAGRPSHLRSGYFIPLRCERLAAGDQLPPEQCGADNSSE